ncbi:MAG: hypothetical protein K6E54_10050 [Bacteroidaceae bacterium]|nr:hypothetical protein [Bacteroidaceae bacterium]
MEKKIQEILLILKSTIVALWSISIILVILGENNIFADWIVEPNSQEEFVLNCVVIFLTVIGVPLSLKFYNLCTTHSLRRMNNDEALQSYLVHACVRNVVLLLIIAIDIVVYYITANITGAMCALIVAMISLYCWPKRVQLDEYLEKVNADEE